MYSQLPPSSFVERLLESDAAIWHRWDRDLPALLQALKAEAFREFSTKAFPGLRPASRRRRLLWLLDRLTPESDGSVFEAYLGEPLGIYAWGRRLPAERRDELTRIPLPPSSPGFSRVGHLQAAMLAWCDACPDDELTTLLEWPERWEPVLERHDICWLSQLELEFSRRCSDAGLRRAGLLASLRSAMALMQDPDEVRSEVGKHTVWAAFRLLLEHAAKENPGADEPPSTSEDWVKEFDRALALPPFAELEEMGREIFGRNRRKEYFGQWFWIWRHGTEQWTQLNSYALGTQEERVFDRLAEIVPRDELVSWDDHVLDQPNDHGEMRAYCRWLAPQYAEVLGAHFNHPDRDWRACAYQNYLAKASEPILRHFWRGNDMPAWRLQLLDRRLFAPESIRPAAINPDVQQVESDLRLEDPFNHRSF